VTQEFYISVTPVGEDEYLVRTEQVAPGVPLAEEQVIWPVEDWLLQSRQLMNDPLLGMLQVQERSVSVSTATVYDRANGSLPLRTGASNSSSVAVDPATGMPNLVALGQQLYRSLFHGTLRDSWVTAQGIAQHQRALLRLRLGLKGARLPRLPWEVLHTSERPLAARADVAFSRYQPGTGLLGQVPAQNQPLRILIAIAAPNDQESLELKREALHLQEELQHRSSNGSAENSLRPAVEVTILEQPGREQLTQALEQGHYQVLHYAGHSNLGPSGGNLYLVSGKTGLTEILSGDDLAGLLVNNGIQMAVFNSCRSAYTAASDPTDEGERSLVEALAKRGIPAVLAMAERIPDEVALTLTRLFYRNLNQGYPVDLSLSRARQGLISAYGSNQLYWALPILYLHPDFDGYLLASHDRKELSFSYVVEDTSSIILNGIASGNPAVPLPSSPPKASVPQSPPLDASAVRSDIPADAFEPALLDETDLEDFASDLESDLDSEDADLVADMVRQLSAPTAELDDPMIPASGSENLLPEAGQAEAAALAMYQNLPDNPSYPAANGHRIPENGASDPGTAATLAQSYSPGSDLVQKATQLIANPLSVESISPEVLPLLESPEDDSQLQTKTPQLQSWRRLGLVGVTAVALLGVWFFRDRLWWSPSPPENLPPVKAVDSPISKEQLGKTETGKVTNAAIAHFSQGNLLKGQEAVEALLDRSALSAAETALRSVPTQQSGQPAINFLHGRMAWQFVEVGNRDYSIDDVRRYWERAAKGQPDSVHYRNALGFAYYAEGNWKRANQAWLNALEFARAEVPDPNSQGNGASSTAAAEIPATEEMLTAYAGLALGLMKSAQSQPPDRKASLLQQAVALRETAMTAAPDRFLPSALSQNWLWTEQAILDWQLLMKVE